MNGKRKHHATLINCNHEITAKKHLLSFNVNPPCIASQFITHHKQPIQVKRSCYTLTPVDHVYLRDYLLDFISGRYLHSHQRSLDPFSSYITQPIAEFLFFLCASEKIPVETPFLAIELYDLFIQKYISQMHEKWESVPHRKTTWDQVVLHIKEKLILRLISCLQIASKLTNQKYVLNTAEAKSFLVASDHEYTTKDILISELRVMGVLEGNLYSQHLLSGVDILICTLFRHHDASSGLWPSEVWTSLLSVSVKMTALFYLNRSQVHNFVASIDPTENTDKLYVICAGGIITAVAVLISEIDSPLLLTRPLSMYTGVDSEVLRKVAKFFIGLI